VQIEKRGIFEKKKIRQKFGGKKLEVAIFRQ
jgi:hypothetical protein